jgi:transposase
MAEAYSVELRQRAVTAFLSGQGTGSKVAATFKIGTATLSRWVRQQRKEGSVTPHRKGGGTPSDVDLGELQTIVAKLGDGTAGEITAEYNRGRRGKRRRHVSSIKRALHRAGFVVKKNAYGRSNSYALPS